ncbi:bifunctional diaminohydroxyphosphoribosylaminopyrimidine deaminase/5-amino-6-(5-phosphoribosylamino)uracil reductase RibD [soil metagenome]
MNDDRLHMVRALVLAERGRGGTSPNPMVGAVIVDREGVVIGRGAHRYAGGPHAEILALGEAGERARGSVLYCTLEPCSHTGRTGPCAPRIIEAGILRAVIAVEDPNPLVAGRGLALLRAHGIEVALGVLREEAQQLNRPFFTVMRRRRPFVTMKVALSGDLRIATAPGMRTHLTGPAADRLVHLERSEVDAIAVGSGTVVADDPLLTPRVAYRARPLTRVVFDSRLRTPPSAQLLSTLENGPVIIVTTPATVREAPARVRALVQAGALVEIVEEPDRLAAALARLAARGVTSLVVEGGTTLHRAFWDAGLIDRVQMFFTPHVLGAGGVEWLPFSLLATPAPYSVTARPVGADILVEVYVHGPD